MGECKKIALAVYSLIAGNLSSPFATTLNSSLISRIINNIISLIMKREEKRIEMTQIKISCLDESTIHIAKSVDGDDDDENKKGVKMAISSNDVQLIFLWLLLLFVVVILKPPCVIHLNEIRSLSTEMKNLFHFFALW